MQCPRCDSQKTRVVDSREGVDGRSVRRRRECESCEFRFTTFERIEDSLPMVVKKGGQRESFDRYKILSGMKRACEKRPVSVLDLEDAVRSIEAWLLESGDKEVSSQVIGERVIGVLKDLDQVAYVRFASVYREFSDVGEFMETLRSLAASTPPNLAGANLQSGAESVRGGARNDDSASEHGAKNTDNVVPLRPAGSAAERDLIDRESIGRDSMSRDALNRDPQNRDPLNRDKGDGERRPTDIRGTAASKLFRQKQQELRLIDRPTRDE